MCGIYGWLSPGNPRPAGDLAGMGDALVHRGPDDRGEFFDPAVGLALGHNRLSIIDLSPAGRQPMTNEDQSVVLVFNGEIYNFQELRAQLEAAGHSFASRTDSEVLVHGYEEWGEEVLQRLQGMFAFAIWDARKQTLFLARDPMGIKPLYYWRPPAGGFVFASELKAFLTLADFVPAPNLRTIRQFLEFNFIPDLEETSLAGVHKLPSGHCLTVHLDALAKNKSLGSPRRFFQPPAVESFEDENGNGQARASRLFEVFSEVVRQHLIADVPVGLLLSGGLDSSLVAALAARHTRVRTLTMGFAHSQLDERAFARRVSQHIQSDHEEILIQPDEIVSDLERGIWYVDDLFGDWGVISTRLLYEKCRQAGVKVVLVGEGSDELFGGYPNFVSAGGEEACSLSNWRRALRMYRWYSGRRWGTHLKGLLHLYQDLEREAGGDSFGTVRLFETRHQLPHCYNMKVDKASMAASVEARVPFLDVRVANEGFRTPRELLLAHGTNKYLLRQMARQEKLLPDEIIDRPKVGGAIAANWMDDIPGFRAFAREVILKRDSWTYTLGLDKAMRAYFDRGRGGFRFPHPISIFSIVAWRLLLLNLWSQHYLRPASLQAA